MGIRKFYPKETIEIPVDIHTTEYVNISVSTIAKNLNKEDFLLILNSPNCDINMVDALIMQLGLSITQSDKLKEFIKPLKA